MLWRIAPLYYNGSSLKLGALQSLQATKEPVRCSRLLLRCISTAQPFLAGPAPIDANAEDRLQEEEIDSNLPIRKHGTPDPIIRKSISPFRKTTPQVPTSKPSDDMLYVRCVQLLYPEQHRSGTNSTSVVINQRVNVNGIIKSIRKQKHGAFAHFTDGSCVQPIQVVFDSELAAPLNNGTSLGIIGTWEASPAKGQAYELKAEAVYVNSTMEIEKYPIQKKYQTPEFLRTIPHLRIRTPFNSCLARLRSSCLEYLNYYFTKSERKGGYFVQVQPPIITSSDCEGAGEVFTVTPNETAASAAEDSSKEGTARKPASFFRTPKYLTVSSQLHLEAYAAELRNVWALSPTFRAEKSDTPRHLAEFHMLEIEMSNTTTLGALTSLIEHFVRSLTAKMMDELPYQDLVQGLRASGRESGVDKTEEVEKRWHALLSHGNRWTRATYSYCMKRLREAAKANAKLFEEQPEYGSGLHFEHERWIVENIGGNRPIFVTHYPKSVKPFYMAPSLLARDHFRHPECRRTRAISEIIDESETGEDTVACFDLLVPFGMGELAGGSLREHRLKNLIQNMRENGMLKPKAAQPPSPSNQATGAVSSAAANDNAEADYPFLQPGESLGSLRWYADLRRFGTMPHGGFGIGWDRLIAYLAGVHNLRDVVPFPRSFGKADC